MLSDTKLLTTNLLIATLLVGYASFSVAQELEFREYRPGWSNIPSVKRPSFSYGQVQNSKLISEAGESLDFLSTDNLIVGSVLGRRRAVSEVTPDSGTSAAIAESSDRVYGKGGFQVIDSRGQTFYVDNIKNPKCAVFANQGPGDSYVFIEQVDFRNCN
ncbi:MAG: hypothetical protein A6F72_03060 [Cycloclasticus sp. symbiont of Poecilosclerida sp. N]|nr:MAG: hypothetical protein A6F72_03060 [Cycloclasticus sp. symbiont of Poecilosclerida sp. N]